MGTEDEDEVEDYIPGENYYSTVSAFVKYEEEINTVTNRISDKQDHGAKCNQIVSDHFSSNDFSDHCHKVAKYLHYIKEKEDIENRCKCLNYLLNTKITFNIVSNKKGPELFKAYEKISTNMETCKFKIGYIREEDLDNIRKLRALHNSFSKLTKSIEQNYDDMYSKAEDFSQLYKDAINACQSDDSEGYCGVLSEFELLCYHHVKSKNCEEIAELMKYKKKLNKALKITVPSITLLTIPFFLYIFYKFTPFGSWVNKKILKKERILDNLFDESQFQNSSEQLNLQDNRYNIKYHVV
ncbi:PIR Superfamily Protein [Plasmodium ovale wallikeri]|uniref:PIR Superfamily Protein n=1 Tax=Plasmodium ovale wallikeri TaxID=864142 RepID=A0A1A9AIF5_PLAOA|nr:PIR Superfamily Protein [Plasmodium ovale wallikeri]